MAGPRTETAVVVKLSNATRAVITKSGVIIIPSTGRPFTMSMREARNLADSIHDDDTTRPLTYLDPNTNEVRHV